MTNQRVEVLLSMGGEDVLVGALFSHRGRGTETSSFSYERGYLERPDAYALDPQLPLVERASQAPVGLPMFRAFADAAPDRWGRNLVQRGEKRLAEAEGRTGRTLGDIDFLLGARDASRQGAIRFRDQSTGVYFSQGDGVPGVITLPTLLQAAAHLEEGSESQAELRDLLRVGSSPGGARPKAHVIDANGNASIAKFPSTRDDQWNVSAWEKVALDLASSAGIQVPESELLTIEGKNVLLLKRFDRRGEQRIGYVSAMTMVEGTDGAIGSYLDIADVIEQHSPQATLDLQQIWRRIGFSILISNTDDHLRNHGFLHAGGSSWALSPAFDMNPDPAPGDKHLRTAIDGYDTAASVELLMSVAEMFRLTKDDAVATLREVFAATSRWRSIAASHSIPKGHVAEMASAFEHAQADAVRKTITL